MKRKPIFFASILILLILSVILFYHEWQTSAHETPTPLVSVAVAVQKNVDITLEAIGTVQPYATVSVRSLVEGQLEKIGFSSGDYVKKGQLLFEIDARPFEAKLSQAQASLASDQAQLNNAQAIFDRNQKLLKSGYVAQQEYDVSKTNMETYTAAVMSNEAAIRTAQLQVEYSKILSPIDGRAGDLLVNEGNLVKTSDNNPLVIINQIFPIYIQFSLPEENLLPIKKAFAKGGVEVVARTNKGGIILETGKLTFINNTVDTTTGMIVLKATFDNEKETLWPGQFVTVQLPITSLKNVVLVPSSSLQTGQKGAYVYVLDKENRAIYTPVKAGQIVGEDVVLESGVRVGDKVVTNGQLNLSNGKKVRY